MKVSVLRLGHRPNRDHRISTHCGLVSRALGAQEIIYSGEKDGELIDRVNNVTNNWGGPFSASYEKNPKTIISKYKKSKFFIVHLTMYGIPIQKKIREIKKKSKVFVVIGAEKVPGEIYRMADYNIAVSNQPHSEVAALAIFLHEYFKGKELSKKFSKAKLKIIPQKKGKKIVKITNK